MLFLQLTVPRALARLQRESTTRRRLVLRLSSWAGSLALGIALAGCAGIAVDSPPEVKQKAIAARAAARWELLLKGDVEGAYGFLSAGSKALMPLTVYRTKIKPGLWRKAEVAKVACETEICTVEVALTYDFGRMKGIETTTSESWIIEKGSAWYVFR